MNALLLTCLSLAQSAPPPSQALAIEHVSVLAMDHEVVLADHTVVVRDGRITALGPASGIIVPEDAQRIDGRERFLMPGLADMHVHVWDQNDLFLFVANGVTTVRNLFGSPTQLAWRTKIEGGELVGPRIYTAGPIIDGKSPVWPGSVELVDPAKAAEVVSAQKAAGYDFLKPYSKLTRDCYEALALAGREQGMRLMGHVPSSVALHDVVKAGQATIEHLDGFAAAAQGPDSKYVKTDFASEFRAWQHVTDERLAQIASTMREAGTWNCPTLVTLQKWAQGDEAKATLARPEMRYVSPGIRAYWGPNSPMNYLSRVPAAVVQAAHEALPFQQKAVRALRDAGAGILLGTDMGNPFVTAGFALHEELGYLVAAGLTPYQALRAGTADAARCMQAQADWGTLAVGQRADMLLLTANPFEDVRNAQARAGVVLRGHWMPEDELHAELERRAASFEQR